MTILTYDWETYYAPKDGYSLSKMTPEEYIRDERFQVIGCSIQVDDNPPEWKSADDPEFKSWLLWHPWEDSMALAHNGAAFDHMILGMVYNVHPMMLLDTLQIARTLHGSKAGNSLAKLAERYDLGKKGREVVDAAGLRLEDFPRKQLDQYGEYCRNDTALCKKLFDRIKHAFTPAQFMQGHLFARMAARPQLVLDQQLLAEALVQERNRKADMLDSVAELLDIPPEGLKSIVMSNKKLAAALEIMGVAPPMKVSPRTGKPTYAFAKSDPDFKSLVDHPNPAVAELVNLRLGAKSTIMETRIERFLGIAERGPSLPVMLRLHGASATGRASGCLVADTEVQVYDPLVGVATKRIVDVLPDDLVWDGQEFVEHDGVQFSGYREVIEHDGITGTPDHVVFTTTGEATLAEAQESGTAITSAPEAPGDWYPSRSAQGER